MLVTEWKACSRLTRLGEMNLLFFYLLPFLTDGQDCRVYPTSYRLDKLIATPANSCKKKKMCCVMEALLPENQHGLSHPSTTKGSCLPCSRCKLEGSGASCTGCREDPEGNEMYFHHHLRPLEVHRAAAVPSISMGWGRCEGAGCTPICSLPTALTHQSLLETFPPPAPSPKLSLLSQT